MDVALGLNGGGGPRGTRSYGEPTAIDIHYLS